MERVDLIEAYLEDLRAALSSLEDVDEVLLELADHLHQAVEDRRRSGSADAVQESLESFGSVAVLSRSLLMTREGGFALPTKATRLAGASGLVAAALWVVSVWLGTVSMGGDFSMTRYWLWAAVVGIAGVATSVLLVGAMLRSGAGRGRWTVGVGVVCTVSVCGAVAMTWLWALLLVPLSLVGAVVVLRLSRVSLASRRLLPVALAWPIGTIALVAGEALELGSVDRYGDHPVAYIGGFAVAASLWAVLLALLGATLYREEPVRARRDPVGA